MNLRCAPIRGPIVLIQYTVIPVTYEDLYEQSPGVCVVHHPSAERQWVGCQVAVAFRVNSDVLADIAGTGEFAVNPLIKSE